MAPTWSSLLRLYQPQVTSEKARGYLKTYRLMGNLRMLLLQRSVETENINGFQKGLAIGTGNPVGL